MADLVIVLPVGPVPERHAADTIDSIRRYAPAARLIVLDDSTTGLGARVAPDVATVIETPPGYGGRLSALYRRLSLGFQEALSEPFDVLLKMDTDALILGSDFADQAASVFAVSPRVAVLGSHRVNYFGQPRDLRVARGVIRRNVAGLGLIRRPRRGLRVGRLLLRARRHGYVTGEHVLGGVCLYSHVAVQALADAGLLDDPLLAQTHLEEDQIFGLCLRSLGFELRGFGSSTDELPFGAAWDGLPAAPEELLAARKQLVHSTRHYGDRDEDEIRAVFAAARRGGQ